MAIEQELIEIQGKISEILRENIDIADEIWYKKLRKAQEVLWEVEGELK